MELPDFTDLPSLKLGAEAAESWITDESSLQDSPLPAFVGVKSSKQSSVGEAIVEEFETLRWH